MPCQHTQGYVRGPEGATIAVAWGVSDGPAEAGMLWLSLAEWKAFLRPRTCRAERTSHLRSSVLSDPGTGSPGAGDKTEERLAAPLSFWVGALAAYRSAMLSSTPRAPVRAPSVLRVGLPWPLSMRLISLWWMPEADASCCCVVRSSLADAVVSPIGRMLLGKRTRIDQSVVQAKLRRGPDGKEWGRGLIVLPHE